MSAVVLLIGDLDVVFDELGWIFLDRPNRVTLLLGGLADGVFDHERVLAILDVHLFDVLLVAWRLHVRDELAIRNRPRLRSLGAKELPDGEKRDDKYNPKQQGLVRLLHSSFLRLVILGPTGLIEFKYAISAPFSRC